MWATRSRVSHTYIRLDDKTVYQASGLTVNETTYECFLALETVIKEIGVEVSDEQFVKSEQFRLSTLGKPYSFCEIVGFVWVLFMKALGKKVVNPFCDGSRGYVCVKVVMDYLGMDDSGENIDPDDLYKTLVK
jgi:hypothetical protein